VAEEQTMRTVGGGIRRLHFIKDLLDGERP
jgi:hypothetical protein